MTSKDKSDHFLSKSFKQSEFRCRCGRKDCDAPRMQKEFVNKLQNLREDWGLPLRPTSGTRCKYHNEKIGGAPQSQHLLGNAADFWFEHPSDTVAFVELAEKHGFGGIGAGAHLVHVDNRKGWARWEYRDEA